MLKENIIVLKVRKIKEGTRDYLLYNKNNPTPFIVCSNYKELDNGEVEWDWGHYHKYLISALFTLNEYDIKRIYNITDADFSKIVDYFDSADQFIPEDRTLPDNINIDILMQIISYINAELDKNFINE